MDKTLLDLDRIPTMEELRVFFKANDFSSAAYMDMAYDKLDADTVETLEYIKGLMDAHWEPLSHEMGLKSASGYYDKDNPLIALRDNVENLAASGVLKLLEEQPERATKILEQFVDDPNVDQHVDDFLHNAVKTLMQVMDYEEVAKVIQGNAAYEDYNHRKKNNHRAQDFDKSWNHTRAQMQTVSLDQMKDATNENSECVAALVPDVLSDVVDEVAAKITHETFWGCISEGDKILLKMRMSGMSQKEIAERLGYKTHSAVTKRLQKLKKIFEQCA